ncbi:methyltransferase domain-containing protein [Oxyplasma meridianum]|uniref:Methyltransferase domain-containing protein n=1 Tax=Oxyplasma meridianum TaxID=3073602 RepID=A0AAX4NIB2_9ARCH
MIQDLGSDEMAKLERSKYADLISGTTRVRLSFVMNGERIFLISSGNNPRWPAQILRNGYVSLNVEGIMIRGKTKLISGSDVKSGVMSLFADKYGEDYVKNYYSLASRIISIDMGSTMIESHMQEEYYRWLEEEFDSVSENYDDHILGNQVNRILRERSLDLFTEYFPSKGNILEIGCGSGTETIEILKRGYSVTAVDISQNMLDIVKEKARTLGLMGALRTYRFRASEIGKIIRETGEGSFNVCYSTYGALNCEPLIREMSQPLHQLISRDGYFIAGVYNRFCASEFLMHSLFLKPSRCLWRMRQFIPEGHSRFCIDVYSYSFRQFYHLFSKNFLMVEVRGVPVIIPPSNFNKPIKLLGNRMAVLDSIDRFIGKRWPFKYLGDHFLMVLRKRMN